MTSTTAWIDDSAATVLTVRREGGPVEIYVTDPHGPFGPQLIDVGRTEVGPVIFPVATP